MYVCVRAPVSPFLFLDLYRPPPLYVCMPPGGRVYFRKRTSTEQDPFFSARPSWDSALLFLAKVVAAYALLYCAYLVAPLYTTNGREGIKENRHTQLDIPPFSQHENRVFTCGEAGRSRHAQCCSSYCCCCDHFGLPMCFQKRCVQRGVFREVCSERCVYPQPPQVNEQILFLFRTVIYFHGWMRNPSVVVVKKMHVFEGKEGRRRGFWKARFSSSLASEIKNSGSEGRREGGNACIKLSQGPLCLSSPRFYSFFCKSAREIYIRTAKVQNNIESLWMAWTKKYCQG